MQEKQSSRSEFQREADRGEGIDAHGLMPVLEAN
jgi:hypothetical protein